MNKAVCSLLVASACVMGPKAFAFDIRSWFNIENLEDDQQGGRAAEAGRIIQKKDIRLFVWVDRASQRIAVASPDTLNYPGGIRVGKVSTGGGLKHPNNPNNPKPAYCADTPIYKDVVIQANRYNMYERYISKTFVDDQSGEGVPMDWAIRINKGIFLHAALPSKVKQLGKNVSGGCVRLEPEFAEWLFYQLDMYGAMILNVEGENPVGKTECVEANGVAFERKVTVSQNSGLSGGGNVSAGQVQQQQPQPQQQQPRIEKVAAAGAVSAVTAGRPASRQSEYKFGPDDEDASQEAAPPASKPLVLPTPKAQPQVQATTAPRPPGNVPYGNRAPAPRRDDNILTNFIRALGF